MTRLSAPKAYQATGVDALFFTGVKTRADLEAISAATTLPVVLGGPTEEMTDWDFLAANGCASQCRPCTRSRRRRRRCSKR